MTFQPANIVIAIDGPTASGKGTLARRLAVHYGFDWLDTGLLYRAVGFAMIESGVDPSDIQRATRAAQALACNLDLSDDRLRLDSTASAASKVAAIPEVRAALLKLQQDYAAAPPSGKGAVLDGRDIGTVVCPDALAKLFVTADVEIRATRRFRELQDRGIDVIYGTVLEDLKQRDARDSQRAVAPCKPADGAFLLDVTSLDADRALAAAIGYIEPLLAKR